MFDDDDNSGRNVEGAFLFPWDSDCSNQVQCTSTIERMRTSTPRPASSSTNASDLDDLFEGEPDPDLFSNSSPKDLSIVASWLASRDADETEMQADTGEQSMTSETILTPLDSGGFSDGDTFYDESERRQRHRISNNPEHDSTLLTDVPHYLQKPTSSSYSSMLVYDMRKKSAHLESLRGESFNQYRIDQDIYSSTGSSDTISICDEMDSTCSNLNDFEEHVAPRTPLSLSQAQSVRSECARSLAQKGDEQPQEEKRDEFNTSLSAAASIQSAILNSKPHLSEVTPASAQGHHPSIISCSSRSSISRASSLIDELCREEPQYSSNVSRERISLPDSNKLDLQTPNLPVNIEVEQTDTSQSSSIVLDSSVAQRPPPVLKYWDSSDQQNTTWGPPQQLDLKLPRVEKPSHLSMEYIHDVYIDHNNVPTYLPLLEGDFQYNSARLMPPLRSADASESGPTQSLLTCASVPASAICGVLRNAWEEMDKNLSYNPWTSPQRDAPSFDAAVSATTLPSQSRKALQGDLPIHRSSQSDRPVSNQSAPDSPCVQGNTIRSASVVEGSKSSSPCSPLLAVLVQTANNSRSPSPYAGLQNAIHLAKRGSRMSASPRKEISTLTNPRGRAVSASPSKRKTTATSKNTTMTCVQGETIKVTKSRTTKSARTASRKITAIVKGRNDVDDRTPDVPTLTNDMDLDLPELKLNSQSVPLFEQIEHEEVPRNRLQDSNIADTPISAASSMDDTSKEKQNTSQTSQLKSDKPSQTSRLHLLVPKTRTPAEPNVATCVHQTQVNHAKDEMTTNATQTIQYTSSRIEARTDLEQPSSPSLQAPRVNDNLTPSTPSPRKKPAKRTPTPYRVQKLILRAPRMPIPNAAIIADTTVAAQSEARNPPEFAETDQNTQLSAPSTPTLKLKLHSKPRSVVNPRKATPTPAPRKRRPSGSGRIRLKVSEENIPPVPPIPTTPNRRVTKEHCTDTKAVTTAPMTESTRLTPQRAKMGCTGSVSPSPLPAALRRSPRLSGTRPGSGF